MKDFADLDKKNIGETEENVLVHSDISSDERKRRLPRHLKVIGIFFLILVLLITAFLVVRKIRIPKESIQEYSLEELRRVMDTPLPKEEVIPQKEGELDKAMDKPLPEKEIKRYSDEELRNAMGR